MSTITRAPLPIRCLRLDAAILTSTGKQVLACMASFADADGTSCYPSTALLARESGLGRRTVERALAHLRRIGAIVPLTTVLESYQKRQAREYRINIDHLTATPRKQGGASARVAVGLPPQGRMGFRLDGGPPSQKTESEEGRGEIASPPPPISSKSSSQRERLRVLGARLGYSTRPDAVEELEAWLQGSGFRSMQDVANFMEYAARVSITECPDARSRGVFLRHVRGRIGGWQDQREVAGAAS